LAARAATTLRNAARLSAETDTVDTPVVFRRLSSSVSAVSAVRMF
jgi:hypothetical protein